MICDSCGKSGAKVKRMSRSYGRDDQLIVIDNVPVVVCPNCGETYLTAKTLTEIERLKMHKKHLKTKRQAPVISYV